jgi:hypothetical protein
MGIVISKSNFVTGLSCPKLLWTIFNAPEQIPPHDAGTQALFEQGHEVGMLAKQRHPDGIEITEKGYEKTAASTQRLLPKKKPLFEAGFRHKTAFCRIDILNPAKNGWDIIEVKSAASVKDEHIADVAFQRYCAEGAGLHVHNCFLLHINTDYVKKGNIDINKLFTLENITDQVNAFLPQVENEVIRMLKIIKGPMPKPLLGTECLKPTECPVCMRDLPDHNVAELTRLGKKAYDLINDGIVRIRDLPIGFKLNDKQERQRDSALSGKPYIDKAAVKKFLKGHSYPLHFLDFEGVNPAVPLFDGTRPFQHIPFQLSLHIIDKPGAKPEHVEFISDNANDPRPGVVNALKAIKPKGTILAYYASYEKNIIEGLAEQFPKERWLHELIDRIDDLIIPFTQFWYYHPAQHGSSSLKEVLPALTGKSYAHLAIGSGNVAAQTFMNVMYKGAPGDKKKLRADLLEYCGQDTQGMIEILRVLEKAAG